jgi:hypothetical protein
MMLALGGMATMATVLGAIALFRFDGTPGSPSSAPAHWPARTKVARAMGRAQIVVFAHPLCSCSQATLAELKSLSGTSIAVEFFRPGPASAWAQSATWTSAKRLLGAAVAWDDGGKEALRFGSGTSGTVLLYGAQGDLLFQGGVTSSRGHQGENPGLHALAEALRTGKPHGVISPVFGCGLLSVQSTAAFL